MDNGHYYYKRKFAIDGSSERAWADFETELHQMPLEDVLGQRMEHAGFTNCICGCTYYMEDCFAGWVKGTVIVETWKSLDDAELAALNRSVTKMEQTMAMRSVLNCGEHISFILQTEPFSLDTPLELTEADLFRISSEPELEIK